MSFSGLFTVLTAVVMVSGTVIIDFSEDDQGSWRIVSDVVMGGRSRSSFTISSDSAAVFSGFLSLEDSGGFASVRRESPRRDLSPFDGLELRVSGDGRRYQVRLWIDDDFDGISYRYEFDTSRDSVMTVRAPFDDFAPTFRGRIVRSARPFDPSRISRLGFLIADGREGPFRLEIFSMGAYVSRDDRR